MEMRSDRECRDRLVRAYEMMLDFYGLQLVSKELGTVRRKDGDTWKERYHHLNHSPHNYLRITRILKSLGELGYSHYQFPLLDFLSDEILHNHVLGNTRSSAVHFWIPSVVDEQQRIELQSKMTKS
eukprot:TRINITY_DN3264_c0_g2_i11.p1 TRINITY_DN3264_c0_g2~~TRINITY_DN3264_c0_g2_i11.p1  ORF type:complete len:126 (-),score=16.08 TRINITY_DN3264_c0_g2_i11:79-456(-)